MTHLEIFSPPLFLLVCVSPPFSFCYAQVQEKDKPPTRTHTHNTRSPRGDAGGGGGGGSLMAVACALARVSSFFPYFYLWSSNAIFIFKFPYLPFKQL